MKKIYILYTQYLSLLLLGLTSLLHTEEPKSPARPTAQQIHQVAQKVALEQIEKQKQVHYTQSEAHLLSKKVRKIITKYYKVAPYLNIISAALAKEGELRDTHYVFYHGHNNPWRVPQDLYKKLYGRIYFGGEEKLKDFVFLRWQRGEASQTGNAQQVLVRELQDHGLVDDTDVNSKIILLSTNIALFGNVGKKLECSWHYFIEAQSHEPVADKTFKEVLDIFNISPKYIEELRALSDIIKTREETMVQIFVPKDLVDTIAYISYIRGVPAHTDILNKILEGVQVKRAAGEKGKLYSSTIREIGDTFKEEKERNPLFKEMIEKAEQGIYSTDKFLTLFCNEPWKIRNFNHLQARLVLTRDLLNPLSGLKFFRYSTIKKKQMKEYETKLNALVDRMIEEHEAVRRSPASKKPATPQAAEAA